MHRKSIWDSGLPQTSNYKLSRKIRHECKSNIKKFFQNVGVARWGKEPSFLTRRLGSLGEIFQFRSCYKFVMGTRKFGNSCDYHLSRVFTWFSFKNGWFGKAQTFKLSSIKSQTFRFFLWNIKISSILIWNTLSPWRPEYFAFTILPVPCPLFWGFVVSQILSLPVT